MDSVGSGSSGHRVSSYFALLALTHTQRHVACALLGSVWRLLIGVAAAAAAAVACLCFGLPHPIAAPARPTLAHHFCLLATGGERGQSHVMRQRASLCLSRPRPCPPPRRPLPPSHHCARLTHCCWHGLCADGWLTMAPAVAAQHHSHLPTRTHACGRHEWVGDQRAVHAQPAARPP